MGSANISPIAFIFIRLTFIFFIFEITLPSANGEKLVNGTCLPSKNIICNPGIILPVWEPVDNLSTGDRIARSAVYFSALMYLFLGISIIADRFMAAIEVITSKEKEVTIKKKNGEKQVISVRIWNQTVSNLTLMALGSSAPEILLSVIEIIGKRFEAGELGPGTIVGSAAFNLFVIIGLCILVIPDGQVRRIKHLSVFFITAAWSVFAYLWLYCIIAVFSPGFVDVWEAVLTFLFFPGTVITAYIADTRIFFKKFLRKRYHATGIVKAIADGDIEIPANHTDEVAYTGGEFDDEYEHENRRLDLVETIKEIRKKNPNIDPKTLEEMAQRELLNRGPKSRAFYRIKATRQLTGGGNVVKKQKYDHRKSQDVDVKEEYSEDLQRVFFNPDHYTVMENVGTFLITVSRQGGDPDAIISVDYQTYDGTAEAGTDYISVSGTLTFNSGEMHKQFSISIIDDDEFEEDEHFSVRLSNLKVIRSFGTLDARLVEPTTATIMILDDDHSGVFHFEFPEIKVPESIGFAEIKVIRSSGNARYFFISFY
ncbi:unnamed protein product [Protopolystoma xenopodis]|uniref:Calx-beta domain-containing protein n=1 Tax=Protopolystoma xenopodis TaxID=117903 RepID=A0A448WVF7_9PLAT|nr:unnamed protein product [Protopolystoma xenopodis]